MQSSFSILKVTLFAVAFFVLAYLSFGTIEIVDASDIVVIQFLNGTLKVVTEPGPTPQWFGTVTRLPKLDIYEFEAPITFNDAGSAVIHGSIQWESPRDADNVRELKEKYGSADAIREGLINKVVDKCVYMTGPLMSSAESYATKKTDLIRFIEDQITRGVYKTITREDDVTDPITGKSKSTKITDIAVDKAGVILRQEDPVLEHLGIHTSNLAISEITYSEKVLGQIAEQQRITMDVQTSMADARKAEQNYITITKNGEANAADAKWKQEVERAKAITEAQQQLDVARLRAQAAEQLKLQLTREGEGEAAKRRLAMSADGALEIRLKAQVEINKVWAEAWAKNAVPITPVVQSGTTGGGNPSNALGTFLDLQNAQAVKNLVKAQPQQ